MCERCGSETKNNDTKAKFKCAICKDIKIERKLLEPLVHQVSVNFKKLKEEFKFLTNLYIFGSYVEQDIKCCDIDFLIIFNGDLLNEFIENKLKYQREEIWDEFGIDENFKVVVNYLNKEAFFLTFDNAKNILMVVWVVLNKKDAIMMLLIGESVQIIV